MQSSSLTFALPSFIAIASVGHTLTQASQPVHVSWSIFAAILLLLFLRALAKQSVISANTLEFYYFPIICGNTLIILFLEENSTLIQLKNICFKKISTRVAQLLGCLKKKI